MSGETMMAAIGEIDSDYVLEFADLGITHTDATWIRRLGNVVAVIGAIIVIAISCISIGLQKDRMGEEFNVNPVNGNSMYDHLEYDLEVEYGRNVGQLHLIRWADPEKVESPEEYFGVASDGKIAITKQLQDTIQAVNSQGLIAVLVTEATGKDPNVVYEMFVKPLGVEEAYLQKGVVFIRADQLRTLGGVPGLAIVLSLAEGRR